MIRIYQQDGGSVKVKRNKKRYKPTGRKRGRPRKKPILEPIKPSRKRPYSIILTSCKKQKKFIKNFRTEEDAYQYFSNLLEENKKVKFPIKNLNNGTEIKEAKYELYILKRIDDELDTTESAYLRNEQGMLVPYDTDNEKWKIIDKADWKIEETFWVYGFDPKHQRKDFDWIFTNLIEYNIKRPYQFKNLLVYQNKLIICSDDNIDIVFCKCIEDSFRLYSEIEELCFKKKFKNIMFSGNIRDYSRATISSWIDKLCEVTGFTRLKIKRKSLRP